MKRTAEQNKILHSLISRLKIDADTKAMLVSNYTNGRTDSSSEMTRVECNQLITDLRHQARNLRIETANETNKLRRNVFSLFYELNWIDSSMITSEKLTVINSWISHKTKTGKDDLNKLSADELKSLITQLQAVKRRTEEAQKKKIEQIEELRTIVQGVWQHTNEFSYCLN